ncbi:MAG: Lrp/AsnC family transcriptional regulator [Pseudomonadota bacterium]
MIELTGIDRTLLRILQTNAKTRLDDLAHEAGASSATVQRRLRYMREAGVLTGETVLVEPETVGLGMTFIILVEMERERLDILDAFRRKIESEERIQQCYYITGDADFALIALARDMNDYRDLIQRLFFDDTNVKRFRTSVVMERTKVGIRVPV